MNVSLPEDLKEHVEARTRSGYSTPSEYVRELIREDQKRQAKEHLDAPLLAGLSSPDSIPVNAAFWRDLKKRGPRPAGIAQEKAEPFQIVAPLVTQPPRAHLDLPVSGFEKYLIFYLPIEQGIDVVRILHAALI